MRDLLEELATQARPYGSTERAIHAMRRRRQLLRAAPFAVAAVVAASMTLTYISVTGGTGAVGGNVQNSQRPPDRVPWLPGPLTLPDELPEPLPTAFGVGPAALIYRPVNNGHEVLVTTTGSQYRLSGGVSDGPHGSLSPDGRWLVSIGDRRLVVRDVTGNLESDISAFTGAEFRSVWSNDSNLLVISHGASTVTVVNLPSNASRTVTTHPLPIAANRYVCGARDLGEVLLCSRVTAPGEDPVLWRVDAQTGATKASVTLQVRRAMTNVERAAQAINPAAGTDAVAVAGGRQVLVRTARYDEAHGVTVPAGLLVLDTDSGELFRRIALPREETGATTTRNGAVSFAVPESRRVAAGLANEILLLRTGPLGSGDDAFTETVKGVEVLDLYTGEHLAAMTVTGRVRSIVLRGQ